MDGVPRAGAQTTSVSRATPAAPISSTRVDLESVAKKHQLNKRSRRKIVCQQISHLRWLNEPVRLGVLRTLLECLMHSRGRHAQLR